jgi:hypothetical protein
VGVLIDGDQSTRWLEDSIPHDGKRRSVSLFDCRNCCSETHIHCKGTIPFISTTLLNEWERGSASVHTPADDLESFAWVLVWVLYMLARSRKALDKGDTGLAQLWQNQLHIVQNARWAFKGKMSRFRTGKLEAALKPFKPFLSLLDNWLLLTEEAQDDHKDVMAQPTSESEPMQKQRLCLARFLESYDELFGLISDFIESDDLPKNWEEAFGAGQ